MKHLVGDAAKEALQGVAGRLNYPSGQKFYDYLAKEGNPVKFKDALAFANRIPARQVFAPTRRPPNARREAVGRPMQGQITARDIDDRWMADIADLTAQPSAGAAEGQKPYAYILCVQNVFSRELYVRAMRVKDPETTTHAFEDILRGKKAPSRLDTDAGTEFTGPFAAMLEEHNISHDLKQSKNDLATIDRAIGTLKRAIFRNVVAEQNHDWAARLQQTVAGINETPNKGIANRTPEEVKDEPDLQFQLRRFNSEAMVRNAAIVQKRGEALQAKGAFRTPVAHKLGLRSYQAHYGDAAHEIAEIHGPSVTDTSGAVFKTRDVIGVPSGSAAATHTTGMHGGSVLINRLNLEALAPFKDRILAFVGAGRWIHEVADYMKSIHVPLPRGVNFKRALLLLGLHIGEKGVVSKAAAAGIPAIRRRLIGKQAEA